VKRLETKTANRLRLEDAPEYCQMVAAPSARRRVRLAFQTFHVWLPSFMPLRGQPN